MASAEFTRATNSTLRPGDWREHCAAVGSKHSDAVSETDQD